MKKRKSVRNFDGDLTKIPVIRNWVVDELGKFKVADSEIIDIKVALTEALSNILRHAYEDELVKPIRVKLQVDDDKVEIVLRDFGKKFDANNVPSPDLEKASEGGYGIYLMRTLLDGVEYVPLEVGTKTVMWKDRRK
ncbi:MAG: ATP-binding protein [Calditrichaeota bacterium]|nr:ATP-binding protein [Calditrichota bacterium]